LRITHDRRATPDLDARFAAHLHRNAIRGGAAGSTCDQRNSLGAALPRRGVISPAIRAGRVRKRGLAAIKWKNVRKFLSLAAASV
jgi:hypothetical protein